MITNYSNKLTAILKSKLVLLCFEMARNLTVAQTAFEFLGLLGKRKWEERKEVQMQSGCKFKNKIKGFQTSWNYRHIPPLWLSSGTQVFRHFIFKVFSMTQEQDSVIVQLQWCVLHRENTVQTIQTEGERHLQSQNRLWLWGQRGKIYWTGLEEGRLEKAWRNMDILRQLNLYY